MWVSAAPGYRYAGRSLSRGNGSSCYGPNIGTTTRRYRSTVCGFFAGTNGSTAGVDWRPRERVNGYCLFYRINAGRARRARLTASPKRAAGSNKGYYVRSRGGISMAGVQPCTLETIAKIPEIAYSTNTGRCIKANRLIVETGRIGRNGKGRNGFGKQFGKDSK